MVLPILFSLLASAVDPAIIVTAPRRQLFAAPRVVDAELAHMRGGLRLPNGLDISLGIDIQTWIDGRLALHTVYASEGPASGVRIFTDGVQPVKTVPAAATIRSDGVPGIPLLVVDRSPTGTTILPTNATAATTVNLVNGAPSIWLSGEGQEEIFATPNGPAVAAPPGEVSLIADPCGTIVTLRTPGLEIRQLIGQATGVVIANSSNDRVIDTISSVNVDLKGVSPKLLSGVFAAQRAALDALLSR
jgi:hypothetical protein